MLSHDGIPEDPHALSSQKMKAKCETKSPKRTKWKKEFLLFFSKKPKKKLNRWIMSANSWNINGPNFSTVHTEGYKNIYCFNFIVKINCKKIKKYFLCSRLNWFVSSEKLLNRFQSNVSIKKVCPSYKNLLAFLLVSLVWK